MKFKDISIITGPRYFRLVNDDIPGQFYISLKGKGHLFKHKINAISLTGVMRYINPEEEIEACGNTFLEFINQIQP